VSRLLDKEDKEVDPVAGTERSGAVTHQNMTHQKLKAIRNNLERSAAPGAGRSLRDDMDDLLKYIDELHIIVHDLRQEPGYALGRQDVLREVLNVLGKVPVTWNADHTSAVADPQTLAITLDLIECLGPVAPHLAPDDLRRENEALRAALREFLCCIDMARVQVFDGQRYRNMIDQARRLLGDDV
jgi:hypothetical protein